MPSFPFTGFKVWQAPSISLKYASMDLFEPHSQPVPNKNSSSQQLEEDLASRMRPQTCSEFKGQAHIMGRGKVLRRAIEADSLSSIILYGPPGTGKTSLARLIASQTQREFLCLSAVLDGIKELRASLQEAQRITRSGAKAPLLFVDEIHRWNKAQQDALLPWLESRQVILLGATTENPAFEINKALLSRLQVFALEPLSSEDLAEILCQCLSDEQRGFGRLNIQFAEGAREFLLSQSLGDARKLLNNLEAAVLYYQQQHPESHSILLHVEFIRESLQKHFIYDQNGDYHYDSISAFIKSVRGSDVDAALYWLAVMLEGGEDPRFIVRRLFILASEDIGMANPEALQQVAAASQALEWVGMPESLYFLSQAVIYLAQSPKSNSTAAIYRAQDFLEATGKQAVPLALRGSAELGKKYIHYAQSGSQTLYAYPHSYRHHWLAQNYMEASPPQAFYQPSPGDPLQIPPHDKGPSPAKIPRPEQQSISADETLDYFRRRELLMAKQRFSPSEALSSDTSPSKQFNYHEFALAEEKMRKSFCSYALKLHWAELGQSSAERHWHLATEGQSTLVAASLLRQLNSILKLEEWQKCYFHFDETGSSALETKSYLKQLLAFFQPELCLLPQQISSQSLARSAVSESLLHLGDFASTEEEPPCQRISHILYLQGQAKALRSFLLSSGDAADCEADIEAPFLRAGEAASPQQEVYLSSSEYLPFWGNSPYQLCLQARHLEENSALLPSELWESLLGAMAEQENLCLARRNELLRLWLGRQEAAGKSLGYQLAGYTVHHSRYHYRAEPALLELWAKPPYDQQVAKLSPQDKSSFDQLWQALIHGKQQDYIFTLERQYQLANWTAR